MIIFLSLLAPTLIGFGDHIATGLGRRARVLPMVWWIFLYTFGSIVATAFWVGGSPSLADMVYGCLSGLLGAFGLVELFLGYTRRGVGIVGPVAAVSGAILPVVVGFAIAGLPSWVVTAGLGVGLVSLWLIGFRDHAGEWDPEAFRYGLLAGGSFGAMATLLGLTSEASGLWPLVGGRTVSVVLLGAVVLVQSHSLKPDRGIMPGLIFIGVLGGIGMGSYTWAAQRNLAIAGLLFQMVYGVTLLFQVIFAGERTSRTQILGFALAALSLTLIILG